MIKHKCAHAYENFSYSFNIIKKIKQTEMSQTSLNMPIDGTHASCYKFENTPAVEHDLSENYAGFSVAFESTRYRGSAGGLASFAPSTGNRKFLKLDSLKCNFLRSLDRNWLTDIPDN